MPPLSNLLSRIITLIVLLPFTSSFNYRPHNLLHSPAKTSPLFSILHDDPYPDSNIAALPRASHINQHSYTNYPPKQPFPTKTPTTSYSLQELDGSVRLNKTLRATHSRRGADKLIASGRVSVNSIPTTSASLSTRVFPFKDVVALDNQRVNWEELNPTIHSSQTPFLYYKFYKPVGITVTSDLTVPHNLMSYLKDFRGFNPSHRVYPIGRLDHNSCGLLLISSDGRILEKSHNAKKHYEVGVSYPFSDYDIERLRNGVEITTAVKHDGKEKWYTAPTKPCEVERLSLNRIRMTLTEGRNRQIRLMCKALYLDVTSLKRISWSGISLSEGMRPGDILPLNEEEMAVIGEIIK